MYVQVDLGKTICGECGSENVARGIKDHLLVCLDCGHKEQLPVTVSSSPGSATVFVNPPQPDTVFSETQMTVWHVICP